MGLVQEGSQNLEGNLNQRLSRRRLLGAVLVVSTSLGTSACTESERKILRAVKDPIVEVIKDGAPLYVPVVLVVWGVQFITWLTNRVDPPQNKDDSSQTPP